MHTLFLSSLRLSMFLMFAGTVTLSHAHEQHAHVHGHAVLNVTIDEHALVLELHSPLDNFLGFEHAPRTAGEKQRVTAVRQTLHSGHLLWQPDSSAKCTFKEAIVRSDIVEKDGNKEALETHPKTTQTQPQHADLEATFTFTCLDTSKMGFIDTTLFRQFAGIVDIDVQLVSPQGQFKRKLTQRASRINWGK